MWNFEKHINIPSIRLKAYLYSILEDNTDIPPGDEGEGNGHPGDALQELDWCLNQVSIIINLIIIFLIFIIIIIITIIIVEIVTKTIIINSWRVWTLTRLWLIWLRASSRICSTGFTIWWQLGYFSSQNFFNISKMLTLCFLRELSVLSESKDGAMIADHIKDVFQDRILVRCY